MPSIGRHYFFLKKTSVGMNCFIYFPTGITGFSIQMVSAPVHFTLKDVFSRLAPATCFPALDTGCMFSRAWHRLHVFPRLAPATCFPALGTGYMFSRAWHQLHVFPRLTPATCFPALGTGYMFSRAWHWSHVFWRLAQPGYMSFPAWYKFQHPLHVFRCFTLKICFPHLTPVTCFPAFGIGYMFPRVYLSPNSLGIIVLAARHDISHLHTITK